MQFQCHMAIHIVVCERTDISTIGYEVHSRSHAARHEHDIFTAKIKEAVRQKGGNNMACAIFYSCLLHS